MLRIEYLRIIRQVICLVVFFAGSAFGQFDRSDILSQLTIYLEGVKNVDVDVTLELEKIMVCSSSDTISMFPLVSDVNSVILSDNQLLLVQEKLPPGQYKSLIFYLKSVKSFAGKAKIHPQVDTSGFEIPLDLHLHGDLASVLFLKWSPDEREYRGSFYYPDINVVKRLIPPSGSVAYVSNEESGNISVVDYFERKVVDIIKVGEKPRDIIYSPLRQQLYVANRQSNSISIIDIDTRRVTRTIDMFFEDAPERMMLSPDEDDLYVLNYGSNSITVYDLNIYEEITKLNIGSDPIDFKIDKFTNEVYVSSLYTNYLLLFNLMFQSEPSSMPLNILPAELEIAYNPKQILIAQKTQRALSIFDSEINTIKSSVNVCSPITSMVYDPLGKIVYAVMEKCEEISIIDLVNEFEIETIPLNFKPGKITLDNQNKHLLLTSPDENKVIFININSRKVEAELNTGMKPYKIIQP